MGSAYETKEILDLAMEQWSRSLYGIDAESIGRAIDWAANELDFPPTIAQFRKFCLEANIKTPCIVDFMTREKISEKYGERTEMPSELREKMYKALRR